VNIEFVSYDGEWPSLCMGRLILKVNGEEIDFGKYCLGSGGSVTRFTDEDGMTDFNVSKGKWYIDTWPENFPEELKQEANECVNNNIKQGCCGGCI